MSVYDVISKEMLKVAKKKCQEKNLKKCMLKM